MEITDARAAFFDSIASIDEILRLFDLLPAGSFFMKDRQGRFVALNQKGCEYCGVESPEHAFNKTDYDFFPKQRADEYRADDQAVIESGEPIVNRIESAPEGEDSPRLVITSKVPIKDKKGEVIGVAGFSRAVEQLSVASGAIAGFTRVVEHIHQHYDQKLTSPSLAKIAGLSASQLERRFRHSFGCSSKQYLIRIRIEKASAMLAETDLTVTEIANASGFYDHAHFTRAFRRLMSASPSAYRASRRPIERPKLAD